MNNVAVFDLDGTLTDTSAVDGECFLEALTRTFGIDGQTADWGVFQDVTDSGILADIVRGSRGTEPTREEQQQFVRSFVELLGAAHSNDRRRFSEINGARAFVKNLVSRGWTVTIATGGWQASALLKLDYGGFSGQSWIIASANDGRRRTDIVRTSLKRAGISLSNAARIVVFGDALWDVQAALDLELPLIGVSPEPRAEQLRAAGAFATIPDYSDHDAVLTIIHQALPSNEP